MLVLNGTKSFADLMKNVLGDPPSKNITDDPKVDMQWVCHSIKIKRKNCVIAMEVNTRYSMIFIDVKKTDSKLFVQRFITRLATEISFMYDHPLGHFEHKLKALIKQHPKTTICKRSDRSVQSHINDVVWHLKNQIKKTGTLPNDLNEWINFGVFINKLLRRTKGMKDYFYPYELMQKHWEETFPEPTKEHDIEVDFEQRLDDCTKNGIPMVNYGNTTLH